MPATQSITDLRATAAMRRVDYRSALKHRDEAAARTLTPANHDALLHAQAWLDFCVRALQQAQAELFAQVYGSGS